MRETISYKKNFKEGLEEYTKKYKPDNPIARGIATIQLYEGDNLVEEYKDENIITDYTKRLAYMDYFYYRLKGDVNGKDKNYTAPFNIMSITNNTDEETADINILLGDVIGWANKTGTYAGSSTTQGTRNESETSFYTDDNGNFVAHFVFDFPTHCANGTFNSIYWHYNHSYTSTIIDTLTWEELVSGGFQIYEDNEHPTQIVCGGVQSATEVGSSLMYPPRRATLTDSGFSGWIQYPSLVSYNAYSSISGYDKAGKSIFLHMEYGGACHLYDVATMSKLKSFTLSEYTNGALSYATGIIYNGVAIIQQHTKLTDRITILDLDTIGSGSTIASAPYVSAPSTTAKGVCVLEGKVYVLRQDNNWYEVDIQSRTIKATRYKGVSAGNYLISPFSVLKKDLDGKVYNYQYVSGSNGAVKYKRNKLEIVSDRGVGAYNKLSSPVTKTAVNTMKIQYDFIIEPVQAYQ